MRSLLAVLGVTLVSGCATITTGQNQTLTVETPGCNGATCKILNDKGAWYVTATPGSTVVSRSYNDMTIRCEKDEYKSTPAVFSSKTKAMTFGNILIGGIIGVAVDASTGAAYDYPAVVAVQMVCSGDPNAPQPSNAPLVTTEAKPEPAQPVGVAKTQ
jgi:uncharacterized protein YceK